MFSRYRKLVVIGTALVLLAGATAGPLAASSSNKTYTATVNPTTLPYTSAGSAQSSFTITYTNLTPSASINSLTVTAPSGWSIDSLATVPVTESSGNAGNYNISLTSPTVTVTNLSPVGYLGTVSVSFKATANWGSNLSCANNAGVWATTAWTGSNLSGNQFALSGSAPTTSIGTSLAAGGTITVTGVTVTNLGGCIPLTLSRSGNSVTLLKPSAANLSVDVLWNAEPAAMPMLPTQVSDTFNTTPHNIEWCGGSASAPALPGDGEVSCLITETSQIAGSNTVQVHDVMFLNGDWVASR